MRSQTAIVVLGCRVLPNGDGSPALRRRMDWAAATYRAGLADTVIGAGGRLWGSMSEAEAIRRGLVAAGVPDAAIVRELCSVSTLENAFYSAQLLRRLQLSRAIVVTCEWHMPRALRCFEQAGVDARPVSAQSPPVGFLRRLRRGLHEQMSLGFDQLQLRRLRRSLAELEHHPLQTGSWGGLP